MHLRVIWEFCQLMLDGKQISGLVGNELVKVDETIEENSHLCDILSQLFEREVTLRWWWLYHVIHLAEKVNEEDRLVIQVL